MTDLIYATILLLFALGGVVVRKTYYQVPPRELKRQAEKQPVSAEAKLYMAVAYGKGLRVVLWLWIALASAGSVVLLAREAPWWLSLVAVMALLWMAFSWLPSSRVSKPGLRLTLVVTPVITWLLNFLHPVLSRAAGVAEKHAGQSHTGIFERDDLLRLVDRQLTQADNRLTVEELAIIRNALSFDDHRVADILTPRKQVATVLADDTVGPVLIDELHKTGQPHVLVRESSKGPFVGTLLVKRLGLASTGQVRDIMDATVYYVHENDVLSEALHAFFATNHPLFVVVNSSEEYVGIITVASILRQLLGHVPGDDFDQYADLPAVAARHPKAKKTKRLEADETIEGE